MKNKFVKFLILLCFSFSLCGCSGLGCGLLGSNYSKTSNKNGDTSNSNNNNLNPINYLEKDSNFKLSKTTQDNPVLSLEQAYEKTVSSVVTIFTYNNKSGTYTSLSSGSGFIYAKSSDEKFAYVMTNAHVINDVISNGITYQANYFEVIYYNGVRVEATVVVYEPSEDIAILQADVVSLADFSVASIGDSSLTKVGETIYTIGSPMGLEHKNTMTHGIVSNLHVSLDTDNDDDNNETTMYLFQVDAPISSGNSGGPLFNLKGEVIGINTLKLESDGKNSVESINFAIRSNFFVVVANSLLEKGSYTRPLIGITILDLSSLSLIQKEDLETSVNTGLYIEEVSKTSTAYGILKEKTIIVKINQVEVNDISDFSVELYNYLAGQKVTITTVNLDGTHQISSEITLK